MAFVKKRIILYYAPNVVDEPIVYKLVTEYKMVPNIIRANISPEKEGSLVIELSGEHDDFEKSLDYLRCLGIRITPFGERVLWDEQICTQCGACTGVCPSGALSMLRPQMKIAFDAEKCVVCDMCLPACPVKAVRLDF